MAPAITYCAIVASVLALSVRGALETDPSVFGARSYNYIVIGGMDHRQQIEVLIGDSYG